MSPVVVAKCDLRTVVVVWVTGFFEVIRSRVSEGRKRILSGFLSSYFPFMTVEKFLVKLTSLVLIFIATRFKFTGSF